MRHSFAAVSSKLMRALSPPDRTSGLSGTHRKTYEAISRQLVGAADQQRLAVSMVFVSEAGET
jgi:hypothetical protein